MYVCMYIFMYVYIYIYIDTHTHFFAREQIDTDAFGHA